MNGLRDAIDAYPGGQAAIAEALGKTQGAISHWATGRNKPDLFEVPEIERRTGISRYVLRPDFFGPPPKEGEVANG